MLAIFSLAITQAVQTCLLDFICHMDTDLQKHFIQSTAGAGAGVEGAEGVLPLFPACTLCGSLFFCAKGLLPPINMLLIISNMGLLCDGILIPKYISPICRSGSSHCSTSFRCAA